MAIKKANPLSGLSSIKPDATSIMVKTLLDFVFLVEEVLEEKHMTRAELAKRLGIKKSAVSRTLSGRNNVSLETMAKYCEVLDLQINVARRVDTIHEQIEPANNSSSPE